ncbi:MAG: DUF3332 domain-containing protein [Tannerella sp.]|jgi:hypothetical protein|nr:DUF3332 domain-containing protein [Tannerella sp.]
MKKKTFHLAIVGALAASVSLSSCIGSFPLFHKVLAWNQQVGEKWVNELVFIVFNIVPVYGVASLLDVVVLNSIEFWSGHKALSALPPTRTIDTPSGHYTIQAASDGYTIHKQGETASVRFLYTPADSSWSLVANGETHKLFRYTGNDAALVYLPQGQSMLVDLNHTGLMAFRAASGTCLSPQP